MTWLTLGLSSAFTASAAAWICEPERLSISSLLDVSTTVTSTRPVLSSASCTEKSSGNCVKPLPHSTPLRRADATFLTLTLSARRAVPVRRATPQETCAMTTTSSSMRTKPTAVLVMTLPMLEPEGSSPDSGSTSTAAFLARRRRCSWRALDALVCPVSSTSANSASTSSGVGAAFFVSFLAMKRPSQACRATRVRATRIESDGDQYRWRSTVNTAGTGISSHLHRGERRLRAGAARRAVTFPSV